MAEAKLKRVSKKLYMWCPANIRNNQNKIEKEEWPKQDKRNVPPIMLHKNEDMDKVYEAMIDNLFKVRNTVMNKTFGYSKIFFDTRSDHKKAAKYLDSKEIPYHTFGLPEKKKLKIVVKGLPAGTNPKDVLQYLKAQNIPAVRAHIMHTQPEKNSPLLMLVVVPHNPEGKKITTVTEILGHKVKMQRMHIKVMQCHRCQKFHHAQRYCHAKITCVKCAGEHWSKKCTKKPNVPPKCANCGGDHTANFTGCKHFMFASKNLVKRDIKPKCESDSEDGDQNDVIDLNSDVESLQAFLDRVLL